MENISNIRENETRIKVIDSLRGFSLLGIVLIHFIEHFNLFNFQETTSSFSEIIDNGILGTVFFLFSGKAYAIFSYLFGFSFFIQLNNQAKLGNDFRLRFAWRLLILLLVFAQLNALFYPGDILALYATIGFTLIFVCKLNDKIVLLIAIILLLQPLEWIKFISSLWDSNYEIAANLNWNYYKLIHPILAEDSFVNTLKANIWNGQIFSNLWQIENGRLFQTTSLFMLGMLSGRKDVFRKTNKNILFWKRIFIIGIVCFIPLFTLHKYLPEIHSGSPFRILNSITIPSLKNFSFSLILVAGYILLWYKNTIPKLQNAILPFGRMSLTNYISMGIVGSFMFFGYGLSLYNKLGVFVSFSIGIIFFLLQLAFSTLWLKKHKQGPFEYLWKKLTWVGTNNDKKLVPNEITLPVTKTH